MYLNLSSAALCVPVAWLCSQSLPEQLRHSSGLRSPQSFRPRLPILHRSLILRFPCRPHQGPPHPLHQFPECTQDSDTLRRRCQGFPDGSAVKRPPARAGAARDMGSIPGSGRSPGGRNVKPLQSSCLENPTDSGAWWAAVHGVAKSWTQQSN